MLFLELELEGGLLGAAQLPLERLSLRLEGLLFVADLQLELAEQLRLDLALEGGCA